MRIRFLPLATLFCRAQCGPFIKVKRPAALRSGGRLIKAVALGAMAVLASEPPKAATLYYDNNGATAGAGSGSATTVWNTALVWSTDSAGGNGTTPAPAAWTASSDAVFCAGADGTGVHTMNPSAAVAANTITVNQGTVKFASGSAVTSGNVTINSGCTYSIASTTELLPAVAGTTTLTLNGGTIENIVAANGSTFLNAGFKMVMAGTGGTIRCPGPGVTSFAFNYQPTVGISGSGGLTLIGNTIQFRPATVTYSYSGPTTISGLSGGTMEFKQNSSTTPNILPVGTDLVINSGGVFNVGVADATVASLSGVGIVAYAAASKTLTINGSTPANDTTFSGVIQDAFTTLASPAGTFGRLTKSGTSSLTLAGVNTIDGIVTLNNGTITVNSGAQLCAAGADLVVNGGTLNLNNAAQTVETLSGTGGTINLGSGHTLTTTATASSTYSGAIAGPGGLTKTDANNLTLSGASSYSGVTAINGSGTISVGSATALGGTAGKTTVASGACLNFQSGTTFTINEPIDIAGVGNGVSSSAGAIFVQTASTVITFGGTITLTAPASVGVSGSGTATFSAPTAFASSASTLTLNGAAPGIGGAKTILGVIALGAGGLTKLQSGTWILSAANTYSGPTTIGAGALSVNSIANVGGGASALGAPTTVPNGTIAVGSLTTLGSLLYTGSGDNSDRVIDLAGTTGGTTLDASGSGALVLTSDFTASGAGSKTLTLTGSGTAPNTISGALVDNSGVNKTALAKSGVGQWVLGGTNTYSGDTAINTGTLSLSAGGSIASSSNITVNGGATLDVSAVSGGTYSLASGQTLKGNGGVNGTVVVASGATVAPGTSIGVLYFTNAPTLLGTTAIELTNKTGVTLTNDKLVVVSAPLTFGGALNVTLLAGSDALVGGETFDLFDATSFSGSFTATNLPALGAGLNWWTDNLGLDGTITVNRAPTALDKPYTREKGLTLKIAKSDLMIGASDADSGDSVSFDALASNGSQGATVTQDATFIYYEPVNDNNDTLQYRVKDTRGGFTTKNIPITVVSGNGQSQIVAVTGGTVTISFAGVPGYTYQIQRSTNLVDWATLLTTNAPAAGVFEWTDTFSDLNVPPDPPPTSAYYQLHRP